MIVFPGVTKLIIDDVVRQHHPEKLMPLVLFALVAFLLQHGFNTLRIILNNTFEQRVIFDLRSDLYSHIQLLPLRWFDNRATGDLMTRVIEDVNSVERMLIDGIEQGVTAILQVVIVLSVMFYFNAKLALLALIPFPFLIAGALTYTLTAHRRYRLQRGDERAPARQPFGDPTDQKFCARERRARSVQSGERSIAARDAGGDAGLGNLLAVDVDVRSDRRRDRARIRKFRGAQRHDAAWQSGRVPNADRNSL